jgi:hypothetical protein
VLRKELLSSHHGCCGPAVSLGWCQVLEGGKSKNRKARKEISGSGVQWPLLQNSWAYWTVAPILAALPGSLICRVSKADFMDVMCSEGSMFRRASHCQNHGAHVYSVFGHLILFAFLFLHPSTPETQSHTASVPNINIFLGGSRAPA